MTKAELLWFLRPYADEIEILVSVEGEQFPFTPEYFWDWQVNDQAAIVLLRVMP